MRMHHVIAKALVMAAVVLTSWSSSSSLLGADERSVTIFAAASTTNAINDIGNLFSDKGLGKVVTSYASSSTLARQIENGAPANVFISADEPWMNYLEEHKLIEPGSRCDLLTNKLVLIAPADSSISKVEIGPGFDFMRLLGNGRLATGDPDHVPVGKYAKAALVTLGVWSALESKMARCADVRAALALVERGEVPLGIVYATDAAIAPKVKVIGVFPSETHPKIIYPVALVAGKATSPARSFLEFLKTPESKAIFEKYGFSVLQ